MKLVIVLALLVASCGPADPGSQQTQAHAQKTMRHTTRWESSGLNCEVETRRQPQENDASLEARHFSEVADWQGLHLLDPGTYASYTKEGYDDANNWVSEAGLVPPLEGHVLDVTTRPEK